MLKTIKARYHRGCLEPLEPLGLEEGDEVAITITPAEPATPDEDPTAATAGAWKDLLDCQVFEEEVYQNRLLHTRPRVRL
jgi:predicted DNA-binding antitoxin AbrB/MazE fold protein